MFDRKKITAFLVSLLMCASAAIAPVGVYADEEEASGEAAVTSLEDDTLKVSGDFTYSVTEDDTICIELCSFEGTELVVPDTIDGIAVTGLGETAFGKDPDHNRFTKISLPASISYISDYNPFMYCNRLTEIEVDSKSSYFTAKDGILYSKDMSELICYPRKKTGTSYTMPDSVKSIAVAAIYMTGLEEIKVSSNLEEAGRFAFSDNKELRSCDLSGTKLAIIEFYTFSGCSKLSEVLLPDTLEDIRGGAFAYCEALTEITLPESLCIIEQYAFIDTGLSWIVIPDRVEEIGYSAFGYHTDGYGGFEADNNFTIVGSYGSAAQIYAKDNDSEYDYANDFQFMSREQYDMQGYLLSLERIASGDYEYCVIDGGAALMVCTASDTILTVPSEIDGLTVLKIYPVCFSMCPAKDIILPETVDEIKEIAFYNCQNLETITLPKSVKTIGDSAFGSCTSLVNADLGGAETIGSSVFENCTALKKVTVSGELKEWNDEEPFFTCTALEEIKVTEGSGNYSSENGILYNKDKTALKAYPAAKAGKSFRVPAGVTEIGQSAFANNKELKAVDLSGDVTKIDSYAFENCEKLDSVKLSKKLVTIDTCAFYNCTALKGLRVPASVTDIGDYSMGYITGETDPATGEETDAVDPDFTIYTDKDSTAYQYAQACGIPAVTGTIAFFGKNIDLRFFTVISSLLGIGIIALIAAFIRKKLKKSSAEKAAEERKAARKRKKDEENEAYNELLEEGSDENPSDDDVEDNDEKEIEAAEENADEE